MPRVKPVYQWTFSDSPPVKHEPLNKRVGYRQGGKTFKTSKPPTGVPTASQGQSDVHYGSHKAVYKEVAQERGKHLL